MVGPSRRRTTIRSRRNPDRVNLPSLSVTAFFVSPAAAADEIKFIW